MWSWREFWQRENGNVAFIFGLLVMPVIMLGGLAIDYSRVANAEGNMQSTLDNAVASGIDLVHRRTDAEKQIAAMIHANSGRETAKVDISVYQDTLRIEAVDIISTPVLAFVGRPETQVSALAEMEAARFQQQFAPKGVTREQARQIRKMEKMAENLLRQHGFSGNLQNLSPQQQQRLLRQMQRQLGEMQRQLR